MIKNFLKGISFALAGIKYFYSDRSLWKYILPVWGIVSLIYLLLIRLSFKGSAWLTDKILTYIRDWPEFLRVITAYTLNTTAVIVMLILVLTTL